MKLELSWVGDHALQEKLRAMSNVKLDDLLATLGGELESQTKHRLSDETKTGPDGAKWDDWSERYAKTRHEGHSLLQGEGHLHDSLQFAVRAAEVELGSNLIYAATHQFGRPDDGIPARPYLGISDGNRRDLEELVALWFQKRMLA